MAAMNSLSAIAPTQVIETYHMKIPQQGTATSAAGLLGGEMKRQKFKLEPIKVLEPSSKKLTVPESQRIMYILEELVRKIEILDYINLIINSEERIRNLIRNHLSEEEKKLKFDQIFIHMCKYHKDLMAKYNKGEYNRNQDEESQSDRGAASSQTKESLELMIKNSTKDILRVFTAKPALFESIKSELQQGKSSHPQLQEVLGLFTEVKDMMNERLLTTPTEQKEKIEYVKELLIREKANNELIRKLRDELGQAMSNKEKEIQTRNDQIRKLESDLKQIERYGADYVKRTKTESEQQESSELKASEGRKAKLQQELNQLRQHFQSIVMDHRDQEQQWRKEKWKHESNVEGLVSRYDEDMGKKQEELDDITKMYEEEKRQLYELEDKFKPLEEEYLKIMEEKRMIEYMRRLEEETLNKKIKAAVTIQSFWRGFKIRKGLFKKKKGKGKGKGKGKK